VGGQSSKEPENKENSADPRQIQRQSSVAKASMEEEQAWLDVMAQQSTHATAYKSMGIQSAAPLFDYLHAECRL